MTKYSRWIYIWIACCGLHGAPSLKPLCCLDLLLLHKLLLRTAVEDVSVFLWGSNDGENAWNETNIATCPVGDSHPPHYLFQVVA